MHVLTDAGILEGYKQCVQYCDINKRLGELLSELYRTVLLNTFLYWIFCVVSVKSVCDESQQFKKQHMKWHSGSKNSKVDVYLLANISVFNQIIMKFQCCVVVLYYIASCLEKKMLIKKYLLTELILKLPVSVI